MNSAQSQMEQNKKRDKKGVSFCALTLFVCVFNVFVCFVALRPKSTAMVMAGWSFHLTTLFPGQA